MNGGQPTKSDLKNAIESQCKYWLYIVYTIIVLLKFSELYEDVYLLHMQPRWLSKSGCETSLLLALQVIQWSHDLPSMPRMMQNEFCSFNQTICRWPLLYVFCPCSHNMHNWFKCSACSQNDKEPLEANELKDFLPINLFCITLMNTTQFGLSSNKVVHISARSQHLLYLWSSICLQWTSPANYNVYQSPS